VPVFVLDDLVCSDTRKCQESGKTVTFSVCPSGRLRYVEVVVGLLLLGFFLADIQLTRSIFDDGNGLLRSDRSSLSRCAKCAVKVIRYGRYISWALGTACCLSHALPLVFDVLWLMNIEKVIM
jgi:hypothetical protein